MGKNDCLNELENVKSRLFEQLNSIKYAINSGRHQDNIAPLSSENCAFCQMMQDNVEFRSSNMGVTLFNELENLHPSLHDEYNKTVDLLATPQSQGVVSKLIRSNKISALDIEKIKSYYDDTTQTSDKILIMLEKIIRRVQALNESRWEDKA